MASRFKPPTLTNPNVVFRLARDAAEIEAANQLVYRNYVNLYWPDDPEAFRNNKYLTAPARRVFVAVEAAQVIGTMSIIQDSALGLPSDVYRPDLLRHYRQQQDRLAEIMSFAVDQLVRHANSLILFLIKFLLQYTFYYTYVNRLIASCRPKHADFYHGHLCFEKLTAPAPYAYAGNVECQLVTLELLEAHLLLSRQYGAASAPGDNFYRFLLVDEHPNVALPAKAQIRRSRQLNWLALAQERDMPLAV